MGPHINPIDTQVDMITEILKIVNVSCNWDSPQYERKMCKQSNAGVVQIIVTCKTRDYVLLCWQNRCLIIALKNDLEFSCLD